MAPTHTHTHTGKGLKLSGEVESELSKGRNVTGGQLVFRHVIFPYAVKAEQMSLSIGRGRPRGLGDTVGIRGPVKSYMIKGKTVESAVVWCSERRKRGSNSFSNQAPEGSVKLVQTSSDKNCHQ